MTSGSKVRLHGVSRELQFTFVRRKQKKNKAQPELTMDVVLLERTFLSTSTARGLKKILY